MIFVMPQYSSAKSQTTSAIDNLSSGVCKEDQRSMSDSDEESVASLECFYGPGDDYFGKYDPEELEDGSTDYSADGDDEDEIPSKKKTRKNRPRDVIMKKSREQSKYNHQELRS